MCRIAKRGPGLQVVAPTERQGPAPTHPFPNYALAVRRSGSPWAQLPVPHLIEPVCAGCVHGQLQILKRDAARHRHDLGGTRLLVAHLGRRQRAAGWGWDCKVLHIKTSGFWYENRRVRSVAGQACKPGHRQPQSTPLRAKPPCFTPHQEYHVEGAPLEEELAGAAAAQGALGPRPSKRDLWGRSGVLRENPARQEAKQLLHNTQ